jgi:hypothetical protein
MGQKIKHRQVKKPRNLDVKDMILNTKGGPMRDRRDRRAKENEDVRKMIDDEDYVPRVRNGQW